MNCVFCSSGNAVKNGKRRRSVRTKQSYICMNCGRQFVEADGFERMRHRPKVITRAIHMHEDGFSLSKVQNHLWQYDSVKVSRETISNWTRKYSVFLKSGARKRKTGDKGKDPRGREGRPRREGKRLRP